MKEQHDIGGCMVLAVASGKGGVGKSVCSILLASEFARRGRRVLLVDGGAGEGTLHVLLGARPCRDEQAGFEARFEARSETRSETRSKAWSEAPRPLEVARNLWLLPGDSVGSPGGLGGFGTAGDTATSKDPRERARAHLRRTERFEEFDVAVVDAGPGLEAALRATIRCSRLLAVAVPEPASLYSAYALIKAVVSQVPSLPIELLVNRSPSPEEAERAFEILGFACRSFLDRPLACRGMIPERAEILRAVQTPGRLQSLAFPEVEEIVEAWIAGEVAIDGEGRESVAVARRAARGLQGAIGEAGRSAPGAEIVCPL